MPCRALHLGINKRVGDARKIAVALIAMMVSAVAASETIVQPAVDGIFKAFETHPLVGLGDDHGLAEGMDFYAELIRDPRFAREVGNVVVEFGAAGHQEVVDRYLAGETVSYPELRAVWTDTVGWFPPAGYLGFARFLAAVRTVNRTVPPDGRIRVWLGEPPIDWSAPTRDALMIAMSARDSHPAELIDRNILAEGKKALVIYGYVHFGGGGMLRGRIEAKHPGAFFTVLPYSSTHRPAACAPIFQQAATLWPTPALAVSALDGAADAVLRECATYAGRTFDGMQFFGPPENLTKGPYLPDYVLDTELRSEMSRRSRIGGPPLVRFPAGLVLRKADYQVDLDAPGFAELVETMFAAYDRNGDGVVTAEEYMDPIPQ